MRLKPVDNSPLPWRPRGTESERFAQFCRRFLRIPKGHNAGKPLVLYDWQIDLVSSVMDRNPRPRLAGWMIGRGNGKSSLLACWAVYSLLTGGDGGSIVVCARNQQQASILFNIARMLVQKSPELSARCQVMKDSIYYPRTFSTFQCLPSEAPSLEGLDFSLCIVDELQYTPKDTVTTLMLAQGKRPESTLVGIGTPPADPTDSVLVEWRNLHQEFGDEYITWREFSAAGFEHHDLLCEHCVQLANPAYGTFLAVDVFARDAKTTPEAAYRRSRLCQFVTSNESPYLTPDVWDRLDTGKDIPPGSEIVLALDGAFGGANSDACALIAGTVSANPHFQPIRVWTNPGGDPDYRVPLLDVEAAIRDAHRRYSVREVAADPYRLGRTLEVLASEGVSTVEFPWSPSRVTRACADVYSAAHNQTFTHNGDNTLRQHVLNAKMIETNQGILIDKTSRRKSAGKIDLCAALIMCHSRCTWHGTRPKKIYRAIGTRF